MNELTISKTNGGLGRTVSSDDGISGFLVNGYTVSGGVQFDTVYRAKTLDDVEALGITEDKDDEESMLVWEHFKEVFRINSNADVYFMVVDPSITPDVMVSNNLYAKKLLVEAGGKIKQLALAFNPSAATTFADDILPLIDEAQTLVGNEYNEHRPVQILLEGYNFDHSIPYLTPYDESLHGLKKSNVSVMVGQAMSVASTYPDYAAIGTLLGAVSLAAVNENIGWVQKFDLLGGTLEVPAINGTSLNDITVTELDTVNDYAVIFFRKHAGKSGIYFNDSFTCDELTSDYAYIENNRTIDKAVRAIRQAILPRLNSPVLVDQETGQLSPSVTKSIEADGRKALEQMVKDQECSSIDVYCDPEQDILGTSELSIKFTIVPTGTARQITVTLGFSNPF